jgi:hypothetical protein
MSRPLSFKESLVAWRAMADNVAARLDEMPHLRESQEALLALVERSAGLLALASHYEAKLREVNRQKELAFGEGRELRNRLAHRLRGTLGPHDPQLIGFGVPPSPLDQRRNRPTRAERARHAAEAAGAAADEPAPPGDRSVVN